MMKQLILHIVYILADLLGINRLFCRRNAGKIRVLMYHGLATGTLPTFYWTHVEVERFRDQMAYLKRHYQVVSPSVLMSESGADSGGAEVPVVLTFDDGLETVFSKAWPILRDFKFPAVCFVLPELSETGQIMWTDLIYRLFINTDTDSIDLTEFGLGQVEFGSRSPDELAGKAFDIAAGAKTWPHERRMRLLAYLNRHCPLPDNVPVDGFRLLTIDQIGQLAKGEEIAIAPHSNTHPILSTMNPAKQEEEIKAALDKLSEWQIPWIPLFAYPNGRRQDFNDDTVGILKAHGFKAAVTTEEGFYQPGTDCYRINRIPIGADMTLPEFKARLSGFFYYLQRIKG